MPLVDNMSHMMQYQVTINQQTIDVQFEQTILDAALEQGIDLPYSCRMGVCATCKCQLIAGEVSQLTDFAYALDAEELAQGIILACQSTPKSHLTIQLYPE